MRALGSFLIAIQESWSYVSQTSSIGPGLRSVGAHGGVRGARAHPPSPTISSLPAFEWSPPLPSQRLRSAQCSQLRSLNVLGTSTRWTPSGNATCSTACGSAVRRPSSPRSRPVLTLARPSVRRWGWVRQRIRLWYLEGHVHDLARDGKLLQPDAHLGELLWSVELGPSPSYSSC